MVFLGVAAEAELSGDKVVITNSCVDVAGVLWTIPLGIFRGTTYVAIQLLAGLWVDKIEHPFRFVARPFVVERFDLLNEKTNCLIGKQTYGRKSVEQKTNVSTRVVAHFQT